MNNLFDLTGKIAVITGGSRGLGLEMVWAFAGAGADVVVASRKLEACEAAADDILVNNAGMSPAIPSHDVTEAWFDKIVSLNFKGPFRLASLVAKRMADGDGGAIINISSSGALVPLPGVVAYSGAKAALNAMTVSLAREYGPKVRVNAISAGPFLTDISKAWDEKSRETANNSLRRPGRPEEIVTTALYLASPASSFVTGSIVRCDGGMG
jgi:NAD(P)-dependent dehydrogenase (short-subunit alcohol dehydrogenase family)